MPLDNFLGSIGRTKFGKYELVPLKLDGYKIVISNFAVFVVTMLVFYVDTFSNYSFIKLLINGIIHSIWIVALYIIVNFIFNKSAFKTIFKLFREKKNQ